MGVVLLMVRNKCGEQKAAEHATGMVHAMEKQIPRGTVQEVLMDDDDKRLQQIQRLHWRGLIKGRDVKE